VKNVAFKKYVNIIKKNLQKNKIVIYLNYYIVITKKMTTTYQIRLDKELKDNFLKTSKQKGLDGSMLIRYFMQTFTTKPEMINFNIEDNFFD